MLQPPLNLSGPTGLPIVGLAAAALLAMSSGARADVEPLIMQMWATSSSCIADCSVAANRTLDTDTPDPVYGSFGNFAVATTTAPGANAFFTQAEGSTTLTGSTGFTVYHLVNRAARPANTTGRYETTVETNFAFITGAEGGTLTVDYNVGYARPLAGAWLHTGLGFSAPRQQAGVSVEPVDYNSLSGGSAGTWVFNLLPNQYYDMTLATSNVTAFSAGPVPFEQDHLAATYQVTMPSFAQAVPEPATWALWTSGLVALLQLGVRRAAGAPGPRRSTHRV